MHATSRDLHPISSPELPIPLLPVAQRPLVSYPMRIIENARPLRVVVAVIGPATEAGLVSSYLQKEYGSRLSLEVGRKG